MGAASPTTMSHIVSLGLNWTDTVAEHNGVRVALNVFVIEQQKPSRLAMKALVRTHVIVLRIFEAMEATDDVIELRRLAAQFDALEYVQQRLWGFTEDPLYHVFWRVPKCTCPKDENWAFWKLGSVMRMIDTYCPIHGDL